MQGEFGRGKGAAPIVSAGDGHRKRCYEESRKPGEIKNQMVGFPARFAEWFPDFHFLVASVFFTRDF
jgi:hypothetical protein